VKIKAKDGKCQIFQLEISTDSLYSLNILVISLVALLKWRYEKEWFWMPFSTLF